MNTHISLDMSLDFDMLFAAAGGVLGLAENVERHASHMVLEPATIP